MSDLTPEKLAELRHLLDGAPPPPYRASPRALVYPSGGTTYLELEAQVEGHWEEVATGYCDWWSDAGLALAAAAINALPSLLAAADELAHMTEARDNASAEVERLTATVERMRKLADRIDRYTEVEARTPQFRDADTGLWWEVSYAIRATITPAPDHAVGT